ncbi:MAG: DEAD/DEAH box helicase, partial [Lachnospiraceae bacterium]|nr:DEAD/DEAH box helicase [Lachnospiraceae bacterium]
MKALSDDELKGLTPKFRERLDKGEKTDALLPEAFAAMREADRRVLGLFPYDVQVMGGIGLHLGMLCEMNTGEGKTLTATMPLYLNSISGKGSILVTTNSYLALRDCEEMGPVYRFMGLSVACAVTEQEDEKLTNAQKKKIYDCDVVYTTNSSLGFDYLFNNLVKSVEDRFMSRYNYVIVDEADAVLLDAAQMPLIIAGSPRVQSNMYKSADFFVRTLREEEDYIKEENKAWLTEKGIERAEKFFRIGSLYDEKWFEINRAVNLSLKAHVLLIAGKDYVVSDKGEVVLLDAGSGRMMPGVKLKGGIHQAIEVKEGINPSKETRSVASVTYPNLFSIFDKLAGMSGTISDTKDEIRSIYGLDTVVIPPNKPVIRNDMHDEYYTNREEQFADAINEALTAHETGQPVLIVVG